MSSDTDKDQYKQIHEIKDSLHDHEVECASRWGETENRLKNIEKTLEKFSNRFWAILAAALSGVAIAVFDLLKGG